MEVSDKQIEKWVKDWITQYGSNQDYQDFMNIVDRIEKKHKMGIHNQPFPYKNVAEIFEKSEVPYADLKTLIKIKGEDAVLQELKTLVTIYNNQFNKVLDQLDVIEGRIDDIYNFAEELDDEVYEKFMDMMNSDSGTHEDSESGEMSAEENSKSYCVCNHNSDCERPNPEYKKPTTDADKEEDFGINYEFDFSTLGALIKDLVKKQMANNSNNFVTI